MMTLGRVNDGAWLFRVLAWDAVLPACVAFVPVGIGLVWPNRRGALELAAVLLPVAAFLLRMRAGRRHIASNRCLKPVQRVQFVAFCFGILTLALIECVLMLSGLMPKGTLFTNPGDRQVWAVLFSVYLAAMVVAMYPGRAEAVPEDEDERFTIPEGRLEGLD